MQEDMSSSNRYVSMEIIENETIDSENVLRPLSLNEFIGQEDFKHNLKIYIQAAKERNESLDHVLLYGPPGIGKTTLSRIIARELDVDFKIVSGPSLTNLSKLASLLTSLSTNSVLFIDEIHRLNHIVEEALYPVMEDFMFDMFIGKGPAARSIRLPINKFTLIGATTKAGNISSPLRDRFGIIKRLDLYTPEELKTIIKRSSHILDVKIDEDAALELAIRSRGTPRIANRFLKRIRDFAQHENSDTITLKIAKHALSRLGVDSLGLDDVDRVILTTIIEKYGGGPVGLETISAASGEEAVTIEDIYEPYLMQIGFVARTQRGRTCTKLAYEHLNIPMNDDYAYNLLTWKKENNERND